MFWIPLSFVFGSFYALSNICYKAVRTNENGTLGGQGGSWMKSCSHFRPKTAQSSNIIEKMTWRTHPRDHFGSKHVRRKRRGLICCSVFHIWFSMIFVNNPDKYRWDSKNLYQSYVGRWMEKVLIPISLSPIPIAVVSKSLLPGVLQKRKFMFEDVPPFY